MTKPWRQPQSRAVAGACLAALASCQWHTHRAHALASTTVCVLVRAVVPVTLAAALHLASLSMSMGIA